MVRLVGVFAWLALGILAGCAGVPPSPTGHVSGRIVTTRRPQPEEFEFLGRTYIDRSLRVRDGGVAEAAVFLEGRETPPWVSGRVVMTFGEHQFDPRVAFVSPGEPIEVGDTRDDKKHEVVVHLEGLSEGSNRVHMQASLPTKSGKPERVRFECGERRWTMVGKAKLDRGRTKELTFDRPVLVPLDWD